MKVYGTSSNAYGNPRTPAPIKEMKIFATIFTGLVRPLPGGTDVPVILAADIELLYF